jgi:allantoin racemase
MKLIIIPPYRRVGEAARLISTTILTEPKEGNLLLRELISNMGEKGQLEGIQIDMAEAYPCEIATVARDEEFCAEITPGILKRVREYSEMGKYDAIITYGSIEPGFFATRQISKIPVASGPHCAAHVASLIGERFSILELRDTMALIVRHLVQLWGLGQKLASIRTISRTSTYMGEFIRKYKKVERIKVPEAKEAIDCAVAQCITAIEKDRADTLILGCIPLQCFEEEIRQGLDEAGYDEIQIIVPVYAAVEMAKAMLNMKLKQAPRAYPGENLKAKPEFR